MRHLTLCCQSYELDTLVPLAARRGYGLQFQTFYQPAVLDTPEDESARHAHALRGFPGPLAMHAPFYNLCPGSIDPLVRELAARRLFQGVRIAESLAVTDLVVHHGYYGRHAYDEQFVANSVAFWREQLTALPPGMRFHIENTYELTPEMLRDLVDEVNDPRFTICLDIGHAYLCSTMSSAGWARALGNRITFVHLHDNDRTDDLHLPLGQGTIPLAETLCALEEHAPDAVWAIETLADPSLAWLVEAGFITDAR